MTRGLLLITFPLLLTVAIVSACGGSSSSKTGASSASSGASSTATAAAQGASVAAGATQGAPSQPTTSSAASAEGPCGLATVEEMSKASGLALVKATALANVCSYTGSNGGGGNVQIKTMTGAEYDKEASGDQSDGISYSPVSGLGVAAYDGLGGLYVKADANHAAQIYLIGSQFVNNGTALHSAELAVAQLLVPRLTQSH